MLINLAGWYYVVIFFFFFCITAYHGDAWYEDLLLMVSGKCQAQRMRLVVFLLLKFRGRFEQNWR